MTVAVSFWVSPSSIVALSAESVTPVGVGSGSGVSVTVIVALFETVFFFVLVAVIVALPASIAVTKPVLLTVATFSLLLSQVTL